MLRMARLRTLAEIDGIADAWQAFAQANDHGSLFQSWTWNRAWCAIFEDQAGLQLDVRVIEDEAGRLQAILPFFLSRPAGPLLRVVEFLGHRMSQHNDALLASPGSAELADAVVEVMRRDLGPSTILHLRHLAQDSSFTRRLLALRLAEPLCARLHLEADPALKDQSHRLGRSNRKTLRWAKNRMTQELGIDFQVQSGAAFPAAFDELVALHQQRFASVGRSTLLTGRGLTFLKTVTSRLSMEGQFEIVQFRASNRTVAAALTAHDRRCYRLIQTGFDPDLAHFSPMRILLAETMRRAFEDLHCVAYDLGAGYQRYKYDWKPIVGTNYYCCLGGYGAYAKAAAALYRRAFLMRSPRLSSNEVIGPAGSSA